MTDTRRPSRFTLNSVGDMVPHSHGEWVKYASAMAKISELNKEKEQLQLRRFQLEQELMTSWKSYRNIERRHVQLLARSKLLSRVFLVAALWAAIFTLIPRAV